MANNAHKLWVQDTINQHSITRVAEAIQNTGASLPCSVVSVSGQIVTVKFEVNSAPWTLPQISIPIATWSYDWIPVQPGDKGLTVPSDVYLGGISGLGGGVADMTPPGNLSALMFVPVANSSWTAPGGDALKRVIQGPTGFIAQMNGGDPSIVGDSSGMTYTVGTTTVTQTSSDITWTAGGITMTLNSSGLSINGNLIVAGDLSGGTGSGGGTAIFNGNITTTGNVKAGSIDLETHVHPYIPGTGTQTDTGAPTG